MQRGTVQYTSLSLRAGSSMLSQAVSLHASAPHGFPWLQETALKPEMGSFTLNSFVKSMAGDCACGASGPPVSTFANTFGQGLSVS